MSDTGVRLRALFEGIAPPVEIGAVMTDTRSVPCQRRAWAIAAAVTGVTLLVGGGAWLLGVRRSPEPPVVTGPPASTSTTDALTTATPLAGWGLDALTAFRAGPVPPPATCPAGSTPGVGGDPAAPWPASYEAFSQSLAAFDRESGLLVEVIEPRGESEPGRYETWTFDPCRNRWEQMPSAGLDSVGRLNGLTYDIDSDLTLGVDEAGTVWAYDANAGAWAARPWAAGKAMLPSRWPAIYHDPSGLIVFYDRWLSPGTSAWAYDVDTDMRYELAPWGVAPAGGLIYDPIGDRLYVFPLQSMVPWRWEPGAGWVEVDVPAPTVLFNAPACGLFDLQGGPIGYDEATGRVVVFCGGAAVAAFDPAATVWQTLGESSTEGSALGFAAAVYDSANGRLILLGGEMWAYDGRTGEWIELLAAAG